MRASVLHATFYRRASGARAQVPAGREPGPGPGSRHPALAGGGSEIEDAILARVRVDAEGRIIYPPRGDGSDVADRTGSHLRVLLDYALRGVGEKPLDADIFADHVADLGVVLPEKSGELKYTWKPWQPPERQRKRKAIL